MNILLVGAESAGLRTFDALARSTHHLVAVLASPAKNGFAGTDLKHVAEKSGVCVWPASRVCDPDFATVVRSAGVDLILNVHSLHIICPDVLDAARIGAFNLHPGPLPGYAGLSSPNWAIYHGEASHAVTLHWMSPTIDAGPIAYCERFPIDQTDTGLSLAWKCVRAGVPLIERLLAAAIDPGAIPRVPQDARHRRYFNAPPPDEGRMSWAAPVRRVLDFVRASDWRPLKGSWPHPRAPIGSREVGIVSARRTARATNHPPGTIGRVTAEGVEIACADEWLVVELIESRGRYENASSALMEPAGL